MDLASIAVAATEATAERTVLAVARLDSAEEEEEEDEEAIFGDWNWVLNFFDRSMVQKKWVTIYRANMLAFAKCMY